MTESRRAFFESSEFSFSSALLQHFDAVHEEAQVVLDRFLLLQFRFPHLFLTTNAGVKGHRGMFYFVMAGMDVGRNLELCPRSADALRTIPGLVNAAFYLLGPQTHILPHTGICTAVMRAHLGVICPPDCVLRIGTEQRSWNDRQLLFFDDTLEHEAWNGSTRWRVVLNFDFFHPAEPPGGQALLRELRRQQIALTTAEHPWYVAAGVRTDRDLMDVMADAPAPNPTVAALVHSNGLFFC